jgi:hypothetical protein
MEIDKHRIITEITLGCKVYSECSRQSLSNMTTHNSFPGYANV